MSVESGAPGHCCSWDEAINATTDAGCAAAVAGDPTSIVLDERWQ